MDFRERFPDAVETLRAAMDGRQAHIWTAMPGIIDTVNLQAMTVEVTPAIQAKVTQPDGTQKDMTISKCVDVPIVFPSGGGYTATFPIKAGDECLLVFASRCIDNWWQEGGVQSQFERRMHDLSDAFAIVGPFSQQKKLSNVSSTTAQLRTNDGKIYAEIDQPNGRVNLTTPQTHFQLDDKAGTITATAPTQITLDAPLVNITGVLDVSHTRGDMSNAGTIVGNLYVEGSIASTGDQTAGNISQEHHTHPDPQGGNTGQPQ